MATAQRQRRAGGALAALLLVLALAACTAPPTGSQDALDALAERVDAVAGVESVATSLRQADVKDRPDEWIASVNVVARDLSVADGVRAVIDAGVTGADLFLGLRVESTDGLATVRLDPRRDDDVRLAESLRGIPSVAGVNLLPGRSVALSDAVALAEAVQEIRPVAPMPDERGGLSLETGTTVVGVDGTYPGTALLARLDSLDSDPGVDRVWAPLGGPESGRQSVDVVAADAGVVAALLAATPDEAADTGLHPRTAFAVSLPDYGETITGWLGLPLGSPEPDDLHRTGVPPMDPAEVAARFAAGEAGVRAFLESAVTATEVPAEVTTGVEECLDGRGTRATASVIVPVFTVLDSAQAPFDAVVAEWVEQGFEQTDRAMGRDFWSSKARREDAVTAASIRGTQEGLSLTATAECVTQ